MLRLFSAFDLILDEVIKECGKRFAITATIRGSCLRIFNASRHHEYRSRVPHLETTCTLTLAFLVEFLSVKNIGIMGPGQLTNLAIVAGVELDHVVESFLVRKSPTSCQLIARSKPSKNIVLVVRQLILLGLETLRSEKELIIALSLRFSSP